MSAEPIENEEKRTRSAWDYVFDIAAIVAGISTAWLLVRLLLDALVAGFPGG